MLFNWFFFFKKGPYILCIWFHSIAHDNLSENRRKSLFFSFFFLVGLMIYGDQVRKSKRVRKGDTDRTEILKGSMRQSKWAGPGESGSDWWICCFWEVIVWCDCDCFFAPPFSSTHMGMAPSLELSVHIVVWLARVSLFRWISISVMNIYMVHKQAFI